ncbi:MAG: ATP phosphoribosyltransferase regulatory subunit [Candidatus Thorarchaeota archaeon]
MSELRTVRGMRDLMVPEILVQDYLVETAVRVFRQFGYEPLDSPVMELWETLSAKGGEEVEAETFKFKDKGDREVGLRFDLTVPLARIVASNPTLPKPFKRYAIGKAWRYDRPQAGRYREFMQADVDVVGSASPAADAEVVLVALEFLRRVLGSDYVIKINSRKVLKGLTERANVPDGLAHEWTRLVWTACGRSSTRGASVQKRATSCWRPSRSVEAGVQPLTSSGRSLVTPPLARRV